MAKFIKVTEKYCGRTFDPVRYINVDDIQWFGVMDKSEGLVYIQAEGFATSFAICESLDELLNLINE